MLLKIVFSVFLVAYILLGLLVRREWGRKRRENWRRN